MQDETMFVCAGGLRDTKIAKLTAGAKTMDGLARTGSDLLRTRVSTNKPQCSSRSSFRSPDSMQIVAPSWNIGRAGAAEELPCD